MPCIVCMGFGGAERALIGSPRLQVFHVVLILLFFLLCCNQKKTFKNCIQTSEATSYFLNLQHYTIIILNKLLFIFL